MWNQSYYCNWYTNAISGNKCYAEFGFSSPPGRSRCVWGGLLIQKTGSSLHFLGKMVISFSYFEDKYMKSLRATPLVFRGVKAVKGQKSVKKSSKEATKLAFSGIFGGVFSRGDLGQYFLLVLWPIRSIGTIIGMKKKSFEIFVKINIFFDKFVYKTYRVL